MYAIPPLDLGAHWRQSLASLGDATGFIVMAYTAMASWYQTAIFKKRGKAAVVGLLHEIDALCVHLEALYRLAEHDLATSAKPIRTWWRGVVDDKPTAWILQLADGQLALISKLGARWRLTEGDRKFVLAHVGDDQLDGAAAATELE